MCSILSTYFVVCRAHYLLNCRKEILTNKRKTKQFRETTHHCQSNVWITYFHVLDSTDSDARRRSSMLSRPLGWNKD